MEAFVVAVGVGAFLIGVLVAFGVGAWLPERGTPEERTEATEQTVRDLEEVRRKIEEAIRRLRGERKEG